MEIKPTFGQPDLGLATGAMGATLLIALMTLRTALMSVVLVLV